MQLDLGPLVTDYPITHILGGGGGSISRGLQILDSIVAQFGGATLGNGLYRVHTVESARQGDQLISAAFPSFEIPVKSFGFDWLGRQFASDPTRGESHDPEVLMFDVESGDALEIPLAVSEFHSVGYQQFADGIWATELYAEWRLTNALPLAFNECVGYKIPLSLGGADSLENMEVSDMAVYWAMCGQLRQATAGLEPGTGVDGVQID